MTAASRLAILALAATLLTACSAEEPGTMGAGGAGDETPASTASREEQPAANTDAPEAPDDEGAAETEELEVHGRVTVDNHEYQLHEVRRCIPSDAEGIDRELELTARGYVSPGTGYDGGDWVQVDVNVQTIAEAPYDDVSWSGPEGVFGSTVEPAEVAFSGTMVTGRGVLVDGLTQQETAVVSFLIDVPEDEVDCRP